MIARGDVVMPGLVSVHQHTVDLLVAGGPTGPTFLDWLLGTYHAGLAHAGPDDSAVAVAAVRAATLAAGVTTMVDCWSVGPVDDAVRSADCADASLEAHRASGGRTLFAVMFNEHPAPGWDGFDSPIDPARLCRPIDASLAEVERLAAAHHRADGGRTQVTPSPELPETATSTGLADALALADRLGTVLPMHLCASPISRTARPVDLARRRPRRAPACSPPTERGRRARRRLLARAGIGVAHCPVGPRPRRAGWHRVAALRRAGARGGIGFDNASLNPSRDLFEEAAPRRAPWWPVTRWDVPTCSACSPPPRAPTPPVSGRGGCAAGGPAGRPRRARRLRAALVPPTDVVGRLGRRCRPPPPTSAPCWSTAGWW